jgi:hypothetical protein
MYLLLGVLYIVLLVYEMLGRGPVPRQEPPQQAEERADEGYY